MQRMPILSDSDMSLFELKTRYVRNYLTFAGKNSKDYLLYLSAPGVYGSGAGNVYIGDQSVSILANNGYIDLNCETHNAYDASGFCNGYVKSEDFPDLKPGKNHIAWSGAIDHVEITPRWWTL